MLLRDVQPEKVYAETFFTLVGIETLSREVQPAKAYEPISCIELGIEILLRVVLFLNALAIMPKTGSES